MRVVVNNTPRPISNDSAAVIERQRLQVSLHGADKQEALLCTVLTHKIYDSIQQDTAEGMLRSVLHKVFENAGGPIDHIPPCMYEFEIHCSKRMDDRENAATRFASMPSLINLGN
jgi:hypothetical protein